jgi:hypothetical protein
MNDNEHNHTRDAGILGPNITVDSLAADISHKDRLVRQKAIVALGNTGDNRAIAPLIFVLSREVTRGASSYPVIIDILDAMSKIPDKRALDLLVKLEMQLVDRNSPKCPDELPAGVITYMDASDGQLHRVIPKELHFKIFDVLRRMGAQLKYRQEEIGARYLAYQDEVIRAEIERTIPQLEQVFREDSRTKAASDNPVDKSLPDTPADFSTEESLAEDVTAGIDYDVIRREMEIEVSEYVRDNDRLQSLIHDGQRIKAHIQHAKLEKMKNEAVVLRPGRASVR